MYKLLLILRYLRRKLAPMFAALAVTLCTAMVIIVISVMGGFLDMMRASARKLTGDVIIRGDLTGFPHYQAMLDGLLKLPQVAGGTAMLRAYGLVNIEGKVLTVQVEGIEPRGLDAVTGFRQTLHWSKRDVIESFEGALPKSGGVSPEHRAWLEEKRRSLEQMDLEKFAMEMQAPSQWGGKPGMVTGIAVGPFNRRDERGQYHFTGSCVSAKAVLTVVPLSLAGQPIQSASREFVIVNEFKSGLYEVDAGKVFVPFALLQKMLRMDEGRAANPETGEADGEAVPARASELMLRGREGVPLAELKRAVTENVQAFLNTHPAMPGVSVETWQEEHATFLGAVEKEKLLLTILFAIISIVAVAMIGVIFYMIVLEKTRDIGVLRALGGSRGGVAAIFLGYGLAIGVVGAGLGLGLASLIVLNINEIQDKLTAWFGVTVWNPEVYYFDRIPSSLNPREVAFIMIAGVVSGLVGALIPAWRASRLDPVESLRYE